MKWHTRFNTVFYKLILTYIIIILFTITFMGISSYVYFSSNFNREIENINDRMLRYLSDSLDENIFKKTEKIYLELFTPHVKNDELFSLFEQSPAGNHAKIHSIYTYLQNVESLNPTLLKSVDIYYKNNNLMISSLKGMDYLDSEDHSLTWLNEIKQTNKNLIWLDYKDHPGQRDYVTLVGGYPYGTNQEKKGFMAVHIKVSAFSQLLSDPSSEDSGQIFIISENGVVAKSESEELNYDLDKGFIRKIVSSHEESRNFSDDINEIQSMVSYSTISSNGWKLVSITPVENFYKKSDAIQQALLLIGIIVVLFGLAISHIFTRNMYNPIKTLVNKSRSLFGESEAIHGTEKNEYQMIDHLINNLSVKVSGLETTLSDNLPIIKSKLTFDLLNGKVKSEEELEERLQLLNGKMDISHSYYAVFSVKMNAGYMENISIENSQFIIYNLISLLEEKLNQADLLGYAVESAEDYQIDVMVGSKDKDLKVLYDRINDLSSYVHSNFMLEITAAVGGWKDSPLLLHESFKEVKLLMKYHYFFPAKVILSGSLLLEREGNEEKFVEGIDMYLKALRSRDIRQVRASLSDIADSMRNGRYSADYCHQVLYDLVYNYYKYVKDLNLSTRDILNNDVYETFYQITNINMFEAWLNSVVEKTYLYLEECDKNKSNEVIEKIKDYIFDNLSKDLSLNAVADVVHLSPRYISRIFKKNTGKNFVDYVTGERMKAAREMILLSEDNIEEIASKVGYNNPAYFTKKFKEALGVTPSVYRMNYSRDQQKMNKNVN
ncbi:AraC family transcriptional regulator [Mesobacillus foraminis]|uniref:AraC family transcriptional regulator n=1 Tax=Mesobacillus foraminis TaxID=279826 RepID=UPI0013CEC2BE|nr:helix-turn-helix domain-containing protein [Mesobacillus foraminis]